MDRENFYLLLKLSVNPPEEDLAKIEAAIAKMQAHWSRYRSHPTKGIEAKKYIGMIPFIRKVMSDPDLRLQEARQAQRELKKKLKAKFDQIDRHINIRMSKGYITDEEVFRLAQLHAVSENRIRERIRIRKQKKFRAIDEQLSLRVAKGYVTDGEIVKLAKLHGVDPEEIRKRVQCRVVKDEGSGAAPSHNLDDAITKVIETNLKILGKKCLYDFLGLPLGSDLPALHQRAREIERKMLRVGKKDAAVTAKGILAGHCINIFSSEQTRTAYDVSRARSRLRKLDADIDVAGMDGKIRAEYFALLTSSAIDLGMDRDQAEKYIREYCRSRKWRIESGKQTSRRLIWVAAAAVIVLTMTTGVSVWALKWKANQREYQELLRRVDMQGHLEEKLKALKEYLRLTDDSPYRLDVEGRISQVVNQMAARDFEAAAARAEELAAARNYAEAKAVYQQYLRSHPASRQAAKVKASIAHIQSSIDQQAFEKLRSANDANCRVRMQRYLDFLDKHPDSEYRQEVESLVRDMAEEYYFYTMEAISKAEAEENWARCTELCDQFVRIYPDNPQSQNLLDQKEHFRKQLKLQGIYSRLKAEASAKSKDYAGAKQVYLRYLKICPDTKLKEKIVDAIKRLDQQIDETRKTAGRQTARALLTQTKGRFVEKMDGVVHDQRTGLMWCLLDSQAELGECLDYEAAVEYVKDLHTGGFEDWRLPTPAELTRIYGQKPFFPSPGTSWYWSSATYSRYADGWSTLVDIVARDDGGGGQIEQVPAWRCGAVRAVRSP